MANYTESDMETIRNNVIDCIAEQMGVSFGEVEQAKHKDDIGVDSLDSVEIIMRLEEEFSVEISDYDMEQFTDVASIVKYLAGVRKLEIVNRTLPSQRTPASLGFQAILSHNAISHDAESDLLEDESELLEGETDLVTLELRNVSELLNTEYMKAGAHEFVQKFNALFSSGSGHIVAQVVAPKTVGQSDGWHIDLSGRINEDDASAINRLLIDAGFDCVAVTDHVREATLDESFGAFRNAARVFSRVYFTLFASE